MSDSTPVSSPTASSAVLAATSPSASDDAPSGVREGEQEPEAPVGTAAAARRVQGAQQRSKRRRRRRSLSGHTTAVTSSEAPSTDVTPATFATEGVFPYETERDTDHALATTQEALAGSLSTSAVTSSDDEPVVDPLIGLEVAERYRIVEQLGRGGMGIVYRVEHTRIGKLLAMKLLTGELSMNKEIVRRFKLEALTVSKLSSPHTVQVFDYGVWNHLTYLVMELVEGQHLARALKRDGPMPFERLGPLVVQVCASLAEAHAKGIVHRDVKPENIMLIADVHGMEVAKVLDFGLAKLRENPDLNAVTLQGAVVGTPYFMSPEQVTGDEIDGRSDIYSLGAVMFRALTGTYPFQATTPLGMFSKHMTAPPPSPIERKPDLGIPPRIDALVQQCMSKAPDERPPDVESLCEEIINELEAMGLETSDSIYFGTRRSNSDLETAVTLRTTELARHHATRAELEEYERKLRRTRYGTWALMALMLAVCGVAIAYIWSQSQVVATDREYEPNGTAADANDVAIGVELSGYVGARMEPEIGDRDFFAFDQPENSDAISMRLSGLPNMPLCMILYRAGFSQPVANYCSGNPGQQIRVDPLRLEAGRYFVGVVQDMRPDGRGGPFVTENISDKYRLLIDKATNANGVEMEPNDNVEGASMLAMDQPLEGTLGWVGDVDVVCVKGEPGTPLRWQVSDEKRPAGTVMQVTTVTDDRDMPPVRVHFKGAKPFGQPRFEADVNSPWTSPQLNVTAFTCVRLTLTSDPWESNGGPQNPRPGNSTYRVVAGK